MRQYNAISLFSGAMGLDLGVERAGFRIVVCVEKDHNAAETIRENTRIPVIENDISNVKGTMLRKYCEGEVTLVVGGPPCQAFSTAGRQQGLKDVRGNLILQYLRIIQEVQPEYFIMENVRGLLSASMEQYPDGFTGDEAFLNVKGGVLRFLLSEFQKIGYQTSHTLFNAANYGVPEKRERVVIIGHKGERVPLPSPTHSEKAEHGTKPWVTLADTIKEMETRTDLHYVPLRARTVECMRHIAEGGNWRNLPPEEAKRAMGKAYDLTGGKTGFLRRLSYAQPAPTLVTSPTMPATLLCHPTLLRPLSIEEYARIQQFPDTWAFRGSITDIYKQIGNAVPVGLGYAIGRQVIRHINGETSFDEEKNNPIPYSRYRCSRMTTQPNIV